MLSKFYCLTFRTKFGWLTASLDKHEGAGAYQHGQEEQELKQLVFTCWLLEPGLSGLFLSYLQTWTFLGSGSWVSSAWDMEEGSNNSCFGSGPL